jgi:hypothetical protein
MGTPATNAIKAAILLLLACLRGKTGDTATLLN